MRNVLAIFGVFAPLACHAVVATTSHVIPAAADASWSYVGRMNGASAVAIGAHDVLTAGHVGAGNFELNGVTYKASSSVAGPLIGKNLTDLTLVHLADTLPGWYNVATSIKSKATITMVGYGGTGVVNGDGTGYQIESGGVRRAGTNTLTDKTTMAGIGPSLRCLLDKAGESVLAGGDSGGGWFVNGKLVGISDFTYSMNLKKAAYGFAKKAYFGSGAINLTDKNVQKWLAAQSTPSLGSQAHPQAVPEPSALAALALGAGALLRRKK